MKVYFNEKQFPDAVKNCKTNPALILNSIVQYIPSDENRIEVAATEADQEDFDAFFEELLRYVEYLVSVIVDGISENYLALLEDMGVEDIPKMLFFKEFKVEGVEWFAETPFAK